MGNLYGSEYWTYLLPKRVGAGNEDRVMQHRLPIGAQEAVTLGLLDQSFGKDVADFQETLTEKVQNLDYQQIIADNMIMLDSKSAAPSEAPPPQRERVIQTETDETTVKESSSTASPKAKTESEEISVEDIPF